MVLTGVAVSAVVFCGEEAGHARRARHAGLLLLHARCAGVLVLVLVRACGRHTCCCCCGAPNGDCCCICCGWPKGEACIGWPICPAPLACTGGKPPCWGGCPNGLAVFAGAAPDWANGFAAPACCGAAAKGLTDAQLPACCCAREANGSIFVTLRRHGSSRVRHQRTSMGG